jgi:hypothetical protein
LLVEGPHIDSGVELFDELCWRLVGDDVPLWRATYHVGVLHPQIRGIGLSWLRDRKVVEDYRILHGSEETDEYRLSPPRRADPAGPGGAHACGHHDDRYARLHRFVRPIAGRGLAVAAKSRSSSKASAVVCSHLARRRGRLRDPFERRQREMLVLDRKQVVITARGGCRMKNCVTRLVMAAGERD